ncbi:hypothetical protein PG988_007469 [Apiospora saccharicola]
MNREMDNNRHALPFGFTGSPLQANRLERQILFTPRDTHKTTFSVLQANLVVIFQALHRTQQHRLLTHTVAEDVAVALGFDSTAGANAVAHIVDHYCSARLAFNRQNRRDDLYYKHKHLHYLVDEEIRWRFTLGTDHPQILYPKLSQKQAKDRYLADTKELIHKHFRQLLFVRLPYLESPQSSAANQKFGVLKGVGQSNPTHAIPTYDYCLNADTLLTDQSGPMPPMREMEPLVRYEDLPKPDPKKCGFNHFIEEYEAKKAEAAAASIQMQKSVSSSAAEEFTSTGSAPEIADSGKIMEGTAAVTIIKQEDAAPIATAAEDDSDTSDDEAASSNGMEGTAAAPRVEQDDSAAMATAVEDATAASEDEAGKDESIPMGLSDENADSLFADGAALIPVADWYDQYTEQQIWAAEREREAEEDLADERRKSKEKIELLETSVSAYTRVNGELTEGYINLKAERDHLAEKNKALNCESQTARKQARDFQSLAAQREEEVRAANQLVVQRDEEIRLTKDEGARAEQMKQRLLRSNGQLLDMNQVFMDHSLELASEKDRLEQENEQLHQAADEKTVENGRLLHRNQELDEERLATKRELAQALRKVEALEEEKRQEMNAFAEETRLFRAETRAWREQVEIQEADERQRRVPEGQQRMEEAARALLALRRNNRGF